MEDGWSGWRLVVGVIVVLAGSLQRFNGLLTTQEDRDQAFQLATSFHQQMAVGDIDGIYNNADPDFKDKVVLAHHRLLFSEIAGKVGSPMDCQQGVTEVRYALFTKQIRSQCMTHFSENATEVETFIWTKSDDQYHLSSYDIPRDAFTNP